MRRLAQALDAGTMTLYHYVRTKDELLALVLDAVMGELILDEDELTGGWRTAMTNLPRHSLATFQRHPWIFDVRDDPAIGPNAVRHFDQSMQAFAALEIPLRDKLDILSAVDEYVFGYAQQMRNNYSDSIEDDGEMAEYVDRAGSHRRVPADRQAAGRARLRRVEGGRRDVPRPRPLRAHAAPPAGRHRARAATLTPHPDGVHPRHRVPAITMEPASGPPTPRADRTMSHQPTRRCIAAVAVAAATLLAACSKDDKSASTEPSVVSTATTAAPTTQATTTTSTLPETTTTGAPETTTTVAETTTTAPAVPVYPITGLPVTDPNVATRQTLVVKIDNSGPARPQSGLNEADMVFEEIVNDSLTRFAMIYQSLGDNPVGPVRSGRIQDIDLMGMFNHPLFAWSGGNATVTAAIRDQRSRRHRPEPCRRVPPHERSQGTAQPVQLDRGAVDAHHRGRCAAAADLAVPPGGHGPAGFTERRRGRHARQRRRRLAVGRRRGAVLPHDRRAAAQRCS